MDMPTEFGDYEACSVPIQRASKLGARYLWVSLGNCTRLRHDGAGMEFGRASHLAWI